MTVSFTKIVWIKLDNRCLAKIIEKSSKYLFKYNKFKRLSIKNKSVSALFKYQS